ncbi:MAG: hypothetical protein K2V38_23435, partial [Gemmataceae bacterium]|nr:hypothetical protein [Gemmataceae bacterium]
MHLILMGLAACPFWPAGPDYHPSYFRGRVVTVGIEAVTIQPEGLQQEKSSIRGADGVLTDKRWVYVQDNTKPPKMFFFTECLLWRSGVPLA